MRVLQQPQAAAGNNEEQTSPGRSSVAGTVPSSSTNWYVQMLIIGEWIAILVIVDQLGGGGDCIIWVTG